MPVDWQALRWRYVSNRDSGALGLGATGSSMVFSQGGLVVIQGMAQTAAGAAFLYDHTNVPQFPIGVLTPTPAAPHNLPGVDGAALKLERGLYVSYSMGTGHLGIGAGRWRG